MTNSNFSHYLKKKKDLLIIWFIINGFAFFVNEFGINANVTGQTRWDIETTRVNLFTTTDLFGNIKQGFWPFVSFYETNYILWEGKYLPQHWFNGLFYCYDTAELIFYSTIIFIILYYKKPK